MVAAGEGGPPVPPSWPTNALASNLTPPSQESAWATCPSTWVDPTKSEQEWVDKQVSEIAEGWAGNILSSALSGYVVAESSQATGG